jgi:hypothetical protein
MTGTASWINASAGAPSYDGRALRSGMAGMKGWDGIPLAGRQGIRPMGGTSANIVTLSGSTITVNLHAGEVTPGWAAVTGTYDVALTVAETHSLTPADATNPRKDIVIGRVYDNSESASGLRLYRSEYIAGTAGPSPSEPSVPQGGIRIATIDVPASGGGSPVVTNNYMYTAAAGGVLPVRTQAERDAIVNPHNGQTIYRVDKNWLEFYDGSAWRTHRAIVAVGVLPDITHPTAGQVVFFTSTKIFQYYNGTAWIPLTLSAQQQASAFAGGVTSATYVPLTGDPVITFNAPASGQVKIAVKAAIVSTAADTTGRAAFEIWTGAVAGSGTGVYSASDNDSIAWQGTTNWEAGSGSNLVTGLTAGAQYTARMVYLRGGGTGSAGFARRRMTLYEA